jgi:hypothetical protein
MSRHARPRPPRFGRPGCRLAVFAALASVALSFSSPTAAFAAEEQDVLAGSPVVRRQLLFRDGRHELGGRVASTLGDPYTVSLLPGLRYDYHVFDWLAVGTDIYVGIPVKLGFQDEIQSRVERANDEFTMEATSLSFAGLIRASVAPFSGKSMLFDVLPLKFDVHLDLGGGVAGIRGGTEIGNSISPAFAVGGGLRTFVTEVIAFEAGVNFLFAKRTYSVNRDNQVPGDAFVAHPILQLGASIFLPRKIRRDR